jgi:type IV pilus assembly protein PilC
MPTGTTTAKRFDYDVRDRSGRQITGQLDADSERAVASKLVEMGYTPIQIKEVRQGGMKREITIPGLGGRVSLKDLAVFSRQFATMIVSGLTLLRTLSILAEQTDNVKLRATIGELRDKVEAGASLSQAMAEHPKVFSDLFIAMVRAGEAAGMLDTVLLRVAEMFEKEVALRSKIKSAMTYPVIVLVMAILLTSAMLIFIVPTFAAMFADLGGDLPLMTRGLVAGSNFLASWAGFVFAVVVPTGVALTYQRIRASEKGRFALDVLKLRLPVFGPLFQKIALSRFARNFSTLLAAGVPILQALEITAETVSNGPMAAAVRDVQESVRQGESVYRPLSGHDIFPPMVVQMIAVGEETGNVDGMLTKIADFYDTEIEATTEALTSLMEPIMIAVIGGIVGGMVIALYMPMFQVFDLIG